MSKISQQSAQAFMSCKDFASGNTTVKAFMHKNGTEGAMMLLHGKMIATTMAYYTGVQVVISTAGHPTQTTKARLNAIPGVQVKTVNGQLFLNGQKWGGSWALV